jgi:hypothetical protein
MSAIMGDQSVLGVADVWRMVMRWHLKVSGGTRSNIS